MTRVFFCASVVAPEVNGGAEQGGGDGGAVDPERVEFHGVFFDEPDDEPALDRDQQPAPEEKFFDARIAAGEAFEQPHFLDEPAIVVGRRAAGDKLEEVGNHACGETLQGRSEKGSGCGGNEWGLGILRDAGAGREPSCEFRYGDRPAAKRRFLIG